MKFPFQDNYMTKPDGMAGWLRARELFNIEDYAANDYRVIQSVMEKR